MGSKPTVNPLPSGRGRGDSCFYQRSIEEGDGAFGRNPREIQRSQSWDDRGERRFEKSARRDGVRSGFEEGGAGPRKEHARSDSENWRSLREEQEDDSSWRLGAEPRRDGDRWRSTSPGKMGARWGSGYLGDTGEGVALHGRNEKIPEEAMLVGKAW